MSRGTDRYAHGVGLEQLLDDVTLGVVEVAGKVGFGQRCQVPMPSTRNTASGVVSVTFAHQGEALRGDASPLGAYEAPERSNVAQTTRDAVFIFQVTEKRRCGLGATILRKSCVEHDFRIDVDSGVEPNHLFVGELYLFLVDSDTIRISGEILIVVVGVRLVPVVDGGSGSADAEPLAEVATLCQRRYSGVLVRFASKNGTSGELVTSIWSSSSIVLTTLKELRLVEASVNSYPVAVPV